jgi:hypothetical protein
VGVGGAGGVVVEVVDDEAGAVGGQGYVQLEKERVDGRRGCVGGAEGEEDVAVGVDEVEEQLGCQIGAETCSISLLACVMAAEAINSVGLTLGLRGEDDDMVEDSLSEVK